MNQGGAFIRTEDGELIRKDEYQPQPQVPEDPPADIDDEPTDED